MIMNSLTTIPIDQLKRALEIREKIETLTDELNELMGVPRFISVDGKSHGLTASGRARIAEAQRLRWSRHQPTRFANGNGHDLGMAMRKPRLSEEGRAKVSAAVKARWERFRAAKARTARSK